MGVATVAGLAPSAVALPLRLTSFVGRLIELQEVGRELGRHRLVTLAGPGGCGKTRLAVEAARGRSAAPGWFVDLAGVDRDGVDAALAAATDAPEAPGESAIDATVRRVGDSEALLMLDNCDQVIPSCARAVDVLLHGCPGLTVLATSREPLGVEGERVWRVPPLSLPMDDHSWDGDAVLLFLDRADLSPDAALRDRAAIHELCRRLDGMPLAIELAAARAKVLPAVDVLAGLSDRFNLLEGGPRTGDARHHSLAASIQWSYGLLTDTERTMLQRLAVFRGPFGTAAARAVAAGKDIADSKVVVLLANLADKSFVVVDQHNRGASYRLLETIREYAAGQLAAQSEEAQAARTRHLRYLRDSAERLGVMIEEGTAVQDWPEQFIADLPDVREAIQWAEETGNADDALRLVGGLRWLWYLRARGNDQRLIDTALAITGGASRWRSVALSAATRAAFSRLDPAAIGFGQEAVRMAAEADDPRTSALAHACLGRAYIFLDASLARPHLLQACELARAGEDRRCLADALEALIHTEWGDLAAVRQLGGEALAIAIADGNQLTAGHARFDLSVLGTMQGRLAEAKETATVALRTAEKVGARLYVLMVRYALGTSAVFCGDDDAAREHLRAAAAVAKGSGNPLLIGMVELMRGVRSYAIGDLERARTALSAGIPAILAGGVWTPYYDAVLVDVDLRTGDVAAAREHAAHAAEMAEQSDTDWGRAHAALARTRVDLHEGEIDEATRVAHLALELARKTDNALAMIDALELLATIATQRRSPVTGVRLLGGAGAARTRIGYARFPVHAADHKALLHDLQDALGAARFSQVWSEGQQLSLADAVALARTRRGSRRRPTTGWDALTPAERRVVEMVAEGLTNMEIAEQLFVTRDTVKGHVTSAFRKLGVSNRAALATEATKRARSSGWAPATPAR